MNFSLVSSCKFVFEKRKDYFCPVSRFSTERYSNQVFDEFIGSMGHNSKHSLVFYSFIVMWS